jgi:hypothetical protein
MSPKNEVERQKVDRLIELYWKLQRGRLFETAVLSNFPEVEQIEQEGVLFDTNVRYVDRHVYQTNLPIPKRYKQQLGCGDVFEFDEINRYMARIWRDIDKIEDDLKTSRILEEHTIDSQSKEIPFETLTEGS